MKSGFVAKIAEVTLDGLVYITFNTTLKMPKKPERIQNAEITIGNKVLPALQIQILPGIDSYKPNLSFKWKYVNFIKYQ